MLDTTSNYRFDAMQNNSTRANFSRARRIGGAIVILATAFAAVLVAKLISAPLRMNGMPLLIMLWSLLISTAGGLWMLSITKKTQWTLTLLPTIVAFGVWILITQMPPVQSH
jgi:hypothetical protein